MKARIFWIAVVLVIAGLIGWQVSKKRAQASGPEAKAVEAAHVRSAKVVRADLADKVGFTGTIRPRNEVDVFPKVPGRIEALLVQVGDKVKAGQVLAVIEHKEIAWQAKAAEAAVQMARANLDGAKLNLDRTTALFQGGSAPQAQVDGAKVQHAAASAQLAQAEAAAGLANQSLANATVVAPITGTVTRRPVNLGMNVGPQTTMVTIQDVATLKLEASVDAAAYARLARDLPAEILVDTHPAPFPGKVSLLAPTLDGLTRRAALEIEVDNSSGKLLPNMFARAEVVVGRLTGVVAVPREALFEGGGGAVVFRIKDGKAQMLRPQFGPADKGLVAVPEGLSEGDEVAISGQAGLADGAAVKVSQPQVVAAKAQN